jgi:hypothetical protein
MRKTLLCLLLPFLGGPARADPRSPDEATFTNNLVNATALLYQMNEKGNFEMLCTATIFEMDAEVYRFLSAAHCVASDDETHNRVKINIGMRLYMNFDDDDTKEFLPAKIAAVGYQHRGDDFAVLEIPRARVDGPEGRSVPRPVIPLAPQPAMLNEDIVNLAGPVGLGKQLFRGHVSRPKLDRPVQVGDINWLNTMLLQLHVDGGSSGSAVVSWAQRSIVAVVVGLADGNSVAIPIARFKKFWELSKAGKYQWYRPDAQSEMELSQCD